MAECAENSLDSRVLSDRLPAKEFNKGLDINAKDDKGRTPLHMAVRNDKKEIIKFLLLSGAEVNIKDNNNEIPLDLTGDEEIVKVLKEHGAKKGEEL